jgi:hypothetical protein
MSDLTPAPLTPADLRRLDLKRRVLDSLPEHGTITKAAAAAGITPRTIQRWQNTDPDFQAAVGQWMHVDQADELAATLYEIAKLGLTDAKYANAAVKAGEILLKSLAREEFGDQLKTESTQHINVQITHTLEARDQLRAEQLARLQALRTIGQE